MLSSDYGGGITEIRATPDTPARVRFKGADGPIAHEFVIDGRGSVVITIPRSDWGSCTAEAELVIDPDNARALARWLIEYYGPIDERSR